MESTLKDNEAPTPQPKKRQVSYRARQIRFWSFVSVASIVAIIVGVLSYKYSEQDSAVSQIDSFAASEVSQRNGLKQALSASDAQQYLANVNTGTPEWEQVLNERDEKRISARQTAIDRFSGTGWFPDLNEKLEKVADKSFGDREDVNDSLKAHAVSIYVQGCSDLKADPAAGIDGAVKKYDETSSAFYGEVKQTDLQANHTAHFRTVLNDALTTGCPTVTPAVSELQTITPESK